MYIKTQQTYKVKVKHKHTPYLFVINAQCKNKNLGTRIKVYYVIQALILIKQFKANNSKNTNNGFTF